jgi:hypothetical protein
MIRVEGCDKTYPVVEAVGMWESRRDFQREWEVWEAGFMAFHTSHSLSFPWPAFRATSLADPPCRSKTNLFHIEFSGLQVPKEDPVKPRSSQLESQLFEAEYLADEDSVLVPADVAAIVNTRS